MAKSTSKTTTEAAPVKSSNKETIKSLAWLVEATWRGFVGYLVLAHTSAITDVKAFTYFVVAAGIYALVTAAVIVVSHFVKAHKG